MNEREVPMSEQDSTGPSMSWGRCYEDFTVGDHYQHPLGRTITDADNSWFTLLTMNTHQLHFNDHYAEQSQFGKQLVVSTLTLAVVVGISVADVSQMAVANLGWGDIELPHPLFVGDTLYAESLVLDKRLSSSRPDVGLSYQRTVMVHKRAAAERRFVFPKAKTAIGS